jgi:RimJ/RimL family protein N-acetyltransferase
MPGALAPRIETERLIVRAPEAEDLDDWALFLADPVATEYVGGTQSRGVAWRNLAMQAGSWRLRGYGMYSLIDKVGGSCIGRAGPHWPEGYPGLEVGWGLLPSYWGRGLALEAVRAIVDRVFIDLGCDEILHLIDPNNVRSIRVAERLGSRRGPREPLPDPYSQFIVDGWHLSRSVWSG